MDTLRNIVSIMEMKKIKQNQLTDYLGVTKNTFSNWKSGRNSSYKKYLPQIAEFLGVSVDYLITGTEKSQTVKYDSGLSENTILICRGGDTKELHFTKEQIEAIEKLLETIDTSDSDNL